MMSWSRKHGFRVAAIMVLIAAALASLVAVSQHRAPPTAGYTAGSVAPSGPALFSGSDTSPAPDNHSLSAELRHCSALGPQDADDAHCQAVWEANRQRFFGRPAQPLTPTAPPAVVAAPVISPQGDQ